MNQPMRTRKPSSPPQGKPSVSVQLEHDCFEKITPDFRSRADDAFHGYQQRRRRDFVGDAILHFIIRCRIMRATYSAARLALHAALLSLAGAVMSTAFFVGKPRRICKGWPCDR